VNNIINDLEKLSKQIESSKMQKASLTGKLEEQMKTLKELGFRSIVEAKKALVSQQAELTKLEKEIEGKYSVLKAQYEW